MIKKMFLIFCVVISFNSFADNTINCKSNFCALKFNEDGNISTILLNNSLDKTQVFETNAINSGDGKNPTLIIKASPLIKSTALPNGNISNSIIPYDMMVVTNNNIYSFELNLFHNNLSFVEVGNKYLVQKNDFKLISNNNLLCKNNSICVLKLPIGFNDKSLTISNDYNATYYIFNSGETKYLALKQDLNNKQGFALLFSSEKAVNTLNVSFIESGNKYNYQEVNT